MSTGVSVFNTLFHPNIWDGDFWPQNLSVVRCDCEVYFDALNRLSVTRASVLDRQTDRQTDYDSNCRASLHCSAPAKDGPVFLVHPVI